jgi:hypothetical protein
MIAKILNSSSSFSGVAYNEKKNEKGQSELLVAKNFDLNESATKKDYKDYLTAMAGLNEKVKNSQFHATISCKGRENSFEQLKDIALQWIEKMGYGNQPFLIYAHNDTANNHIHIVSVRVNENGQKIDHNFEKLRSQRALNEIMKLDYSKKAEQDFKTFSSYSFSTVAQFKMLFEQAGWALAEKDEKIHLIKGGECRKKIDKKQINKMIKNNVSTLDTNRAKQITALLHKYREGLTHTQLKSLMKSKFGIDMIYHTGKDHTAPFGYSLIDHSGRRVYKGSDLVNIKDLLANPERDGKIKTCSALVETIVNNTLNPDFDNFKKEMNALGYKVDAKGKIYIIGEKTALFSLSRKELNKIQYNSRLNQANQYSAGSRGEAGVLSKLFFVKANDISIQDKQRNISTTLYYSEMMKSYLENSSNMQEVMKSKNISLMQMDNDLYLIDTSNKEVVSNRDLNINFGRDLDFVRILDADRFGEFNLNEHSQVANGIGLIDALDEFLNQSFGGEQDRKRKRHHDVNQ